MTTRQMAHSTWTIRPDRVEEGAGDNPCQREHEAALSLVGRTQATPSDTADAALLALPAGVLVLDERGVIQLANRAAHSMLDENVTGMLWRDVIGRFFILHAESGEDEVTLVDGRRVSIRTCPLDDRPGQILLLNDVTEVASLRQQVKRQQRLTALGEVSASLAHQIRTPLATALLYLSHVAEDTAGSAAAQTLGRVRKSLGNIEALVRDMLLFVRGEVLDAKPIKVGSLLEELRDSLTQQLHNAAVDLNLSKPRAPAALLGNREVLLSVLQNLVDNAIEAGASNIDVRCDEVRSRDPQLVIEIRDDGKGMPEEVARRVFDPFFTTRAGGTGLGLAVARNVVRAHGGDIEVHRNSDQGCTMVMHLPAIAAVVHSDYSEPANAARMAAEVRA